MPSKTNMPKSSATRWLRAFFVTILLWIPSATVSAQSLSDRYRLALEDSLILYQYLKPAYQKLEIAHKFSNEAYLALRHENDMLRQLDRIKEEEYQKAVAQFLKELKRAKAWGNTKTILAIAATVAITRKR